LQESVCDRPPQGNSTEENQDNEGISKLKSLVPSVPSVSIPLLRKLNWHLVLAGAAKEWTA
jgi:hypothetical protein